MDDLNTVSLLSEMDVLEDIVGCFSHVAFVEFLLANDKRSMRSDKQERKPRDYF